MPITAQRLNDLLTEHELVLEIIATFKKQILDDVIGDKYANLSPEEKLAEITRAFNALHLPDKFAIIERKFYRMNIKKNIRAKEKMRMRRRRDGVPERILPTSPEHAEADLHAWRVQQPIDAEYERALGGLVPGKDQLDAPSAFVERKKSYVYDPDKPMDNASFLEMIGEAPKPKTQEEIVAEGMAMLDSLPTANDEEEPATRGEESAAGSHLSPIELAITKKFTSK